MFWNSGFILSEGLPRALEFSKVDRQHPSTNNMRSRFTHLSLYIWKIKKLFFFLGKENQGTSSSWNQFTEVNKDVVEKNRLS